VRSAIAADSRSAGKKTGPVKQHNRIRIAYIAGRLITGRCIATLFDCNSRTQIEIDSLPDACGLREFDLKYRDNSGLNGSTCHCQYGCEKKHSIDLTIKGNTFIGYITGSSAIFMGNVRGDSIYIFDREDSLNLQYRISGCIVDLAGTDGVCTLCWMVK